MSIAEQDWHTTFTEPVLQRLVKDALKSNLDLKIAAQHVIEAQVSIVRSQLTTKRLETPTGIGAKPLFFTEDAEGTVCVSI